MWYIQLALLISVGGFVLYLLILERRGRITQYTERYQQSNLIARILNSIALLPLAYTGLWMTVAFIFSRIYKHIAGDKT